MNFDSIYNAFVSASEWFINDFLHPLMNFINNTPLVSAAILVTFGIPALIYVLYVYRDISNSTEDMTFNQGDKMIMRINKHEKRMKKKMQKQRQEAIESQRSARGYSPGKSNKYVDAYIRSLKYDNK